MPKLTSIISKGFGDEKEIEFSIVTAMEIIAEIGKHYPDMVMTAMPILQDGLKRFEKTKTPRILAAIIYAMACIGKNQPSLAKSIVPQFLTLLKHQNFFVRGHAAWALGYIKSEGEQAKEAIEALARLARLFGDNSKFILIGLDKTVSVRDMARRAIRSIEGRGVVFGSEKNTSEKKSSLTKKSRRDKKTIR
ncbi:MAG: HEAT repeat domain-containing protein [Candidatus Aenigmarchaeota archaeon]|nr:HEAT repeat domain-containing protein [Candidatus Aenigmarchaeota archaeon]